MSTGAMAQEITGDYCVSLNPLGTSNNTYTASLLAGNFRDYAPPGSICTGWQYSMDLIPPGATPPVTVSSSDRKIRLLFYSPGVYVLKALIPCIGTDVFRKTIIVTKGSDFSGTMDVNLTNNCAAPYTSFTITHSSSGGNPIASYATQVTEVDAAGNPTGNFNWSNTPIYPANGIVPTINMNSSNGPSLQAGKRYRVRLNFTTPYCANAGNQYTERFIDIKAGSTATPVINVNGSTAAPYSYYAFDPTQPLNINNTESGSANSCGTIDMEVTRLSAANNTTNCSSSGPVSVISGITNTSSFNFKALYPIVVNEGGWFKVRIRKTGSFGTGAWSNAVCILSYKSNEPQFQVKSLTSLVPRAYQSVARSTTFTAPTLMGARSAEINSITVSSSGGYPITKYRIWVYKAVDGNALNDVQIGYNEVAVAAGANSIALQDVDILGVCTTCAPTYNGYFETNVNNTTVTGQTYKVKLAVGLNVQGNTIWTDATKQPFAFFKIQPGCTSCRSTNNSVNFDETAAEPLNQLSLSPNPTKDKLWVEVPNLIHGETANLTISDLTGKTLMEQISSGMTEGDKIGIDVSALSSGMYFCTLRSGTVISTQKFIKD